LVSTVDGLSQVGYVSSLDLVSTVAGLGELYLSTNASGNIASTVAGLGNYYISTSGLTSTVAGLGHLGYVSSASLVSTSAGLGQTYFSTLISTFSTVYADSVVSPFFLQVQYYPF
jgi:hypothetical protein